jgi:hypothetical protein
LEQGDFSYYRRLRPEKLEEMDGWGLFLDFQGKAIDTHWGIAAFRPHEHPGKTRGYLPGQIRKPAYVSEISSKNCDISRSLLPVSEPWGTRGVRGGQGKVDMDSTRETLHKYHRHFPFWHVRELK